MVSVGSSEDVGQLPSRNALDLFRLANLWKFLLAVMDGSSPSGIIAPSPILGQILDLRCWSEKRDIIMMQKNYENRVG